MRQVRDDADFGEAGEIAEAAADGDGEAGATSAGSGLPWDGDDTRDYTYEELLGARVAATLPRTAAPCPAGCQRSLRWQHAL